MTSQKINVALVGLSFGLEFLPIYLNHPNVSEVAICDQNEETLEKIGNAFSIKDRFSELDQLLTSDKYDAVHLVTPITYHAEQSIAVLKANKHCACTIPMGLTIKELEDVIEAKEQSKKVYMMMETAVYTREFLFVKELYQQGDFGSIQFLRGAHYQDMDGWPSYWKGLPPLLHPTHAIAPPLALLGKKAVNVRSLGSGIMRDELKQQYNNPYPIETAIYQLEDSDAALELTRSMFHTARAYTESFNIYGEKATFEWQQIEEEKPILFRMGELKAERGRPISYERITIPDRQTLLPKEIQRFTQSGVYDQDNQHLSFIQGGGHGGSHPHLVHEFVSSIIEGRESSINAETAANWTAAGICAHQSAMNRGVPIEIPTF
ncbi:Gfo/Idh/MocA family protein [Oceanobacillus sojae]|uniref:Gfo/Idh/MocA family protein n=1 Tax=Oceanobacillus sojae TaxID=582851 RepID=UPI0021A68250|nr:Gfo/Idh/MocA family oxidoreductase [Oceanobacillus sojae]MCT1905244.1 Gfo/Idh/MocA family oxidoreductase [Oceanobacillus sojae]